MTNNIEYKENKDWRHIMTNKYRRFSIKRLFLFLMIGIVIASFTACNKKGPMTFPADDSQSSVMTVSASKTGPLDQSGNTITNIVYITNVVQVTNEIIWYITNEIYHPGKEIYKTNFVTNKVSSGKDIIHTNYVYVEREKVEWVTNVVPDEEYVSRWHKSFMYRVYAPFSGIGKEGEFKYTNVSYHDPDTLSELWKKMMRMESTDGKEFTIRDRNQRTFFYFDKDANIRWSKRPNDIVKKFQHGIIIQHRCGNDTKGAYAIAGVYRLTKSSAEMRGWGDDGVNIIQGYYFRQERRTHEYDIVVLNPGHVVNGSEYGFELYHSSWNYPAGISPYLEQRPEYVMSKVTHVFEAWKNWRPNELYDMPFQISSSSSIPK